MEGGGGVQESFCFLYPPPPTGGLRGGTGKNMHGCKIEHLNLKNCGLKYLSNWSFKRQRLYNIIIGIDKCANLRNSLKSIDLSFYNWEKDKEIFVKRINEILRVNNIKFKYEIIN